MKQVPHWLTRAHTVVTHKGEAHFDDTAACAVLLGISPALKVERRDVTPDDLENRGLILVDVGGHHAPALGHFDHHQFPRDYPPTCALTLVLDALGLLDAARKFWPWLKFKETLDSKGPSGAALAAWDAADDGALWIESHGKHGIKPAEFWDRVLAPAMSPAESYLLRRFRDGPDTDAVRDLLTDMGQEWLSGLEKLQARYDLLGDKVTTSDAAVPGIKVAVVDVPRDRQPTLALETWLHDHHPDAAVTVTQDDRGPGWCLFRRNDHPKVDFSRVESRGEVLFAHKGGFVAKTRDMLDMTAVIYLIRLATSE